jgi:hypothetical protein
MKCGMSPEEWSSLYDVIFVSEMKRRLTEECIAKFGKPPFFHSNGAWQAEEWHKREVFKSEIYDRVRDALLASERFKALLPSEYSYVLTDKPGEIGIYKTDFSPSEGVFSK